MENNEVNTNQQQEQTSSQAAQHAQAMQAAEPPAAPAEPAAPAQPAQAAPAPSEPAASLQAVEAAQATPVQAAQPVHPVQATQAAQPVQPVLPAQSVPPSAQPVQPAQNIPQATPAPYQNYPQSYAQTPYSQTTYTQPGYSQQPYTQQPYDQQTYTQAAQTPYPQQPYAQPIYPSNQKPAKKKVWPWVLGTCLVVFLLCMGGCVGCVACSVLTSDYNPSGSSNSQNNNGYNYGYNYGYGNSGNDNSGNGSSGSSSATYTKSEIEEIMKDEYNISNTSAKDNRGTSGIYEVGAGKDLKPGLYYLEGSQSEESNYYTFTKQGEDTYVVDDSVVYFGNYFTNLEEGDLIAFIGAGESSIYPASNDALGVSSPYQSGVYRVGIDIAAGEYVVTAQSNMAASTSQEAAAYIMKDLEFNNDSIVSTKYVIAGGSQTITLEDGQYVELYAATMKPKEG